MMSKQFKRNSYLVAETIFVFFIISFFSVVIQQQSISLLLYFPLLLFQGFWFYRFYIVAHEASHNKLFNNKFANDFWGTIILIPLMVPITIYRKIHMFHHGYNRRDYHTSALDTFTMKNKSFFKKIYFYFLWYISVFFGGFFIHSLVSVFLFLFIPPRLARKISPAFNHWTLMDQLKAIFLFLLGILFHLLVYFVFGKEAYLYVLLYPLLSFAWVLSMIVYIFHYRTTIGAKVKYNVRSLKQVPVLSWILMNFNNHATHHQNQDIPWYDLPEKRKELPLEYEKINQNTHNFFKAIMNQLKGPQIIYDQN